MGVPEWGPWHLETPALGTPTLGPRHTWQPELTDPQPGGLPAPAPQCPCSSPRTLSPGGLLSQARGSSLPRVPTYRARVQLRHRLLFLLLFLLGPPAQRHLPQLRGPGSRAWGHSRVRTPRPARALRWSLSAVSPRPPGHPGPCSPVVTKGCLGAPAGPCGCCCCWWSWGRRGRNGREPGSVLRSAQRHPEPSTAARAPHHSRAPTTAEPPRTGTRSPPRASRAGVPQPGTLPSPKGVAQGATR